MDNQLLAYLTEKDGAVSRETPGPELLRLASAAGTTPYYLYMLALGHKQFAPLLAAKIERATDGVLSRKVLCDSFPWDGLPASDEPQVA